MNVRIDNQQNIPEAVRSRVWPSVAAVGRGGRLWFGVACIAAMAGAGAWAMPGPPPTAAAPVGTRADRPDGALRLIEAVRRDRVDAVRQLVGAGLAVDACAPGDGTALIVAARGGDPAMLDALLGL
ncbi:MAG: hypothetical protein ACTHJO_12185, partial [Rhodanobacter sp.]